jgi:hypothetical protein
LNLTTPAGELDFRFAYNLTGTVPEIVTIPLKFTVPPAAPVAVAENTEEPTVR